MTESVVIAIAAIWIAIGLTTAWYMGRRGHSPYAWGVIGTVFGPMVVFLAVDAIYHGSDGNYYVGNTRWHPDANLYGYPTIKIAFYLDSVG